MYQAYVEVRETQHFRMYAIFFGGGGGGGMGS